MCIFIAEDFYTGVIAFEQLNNGYTKKTVIALDKRDNNLYINAKNFIKAYEPIVLRSDKDIMIKEIRKLKERFDQIRDYCREKFSKYGEVDMEETFESLYADLKKICDEYGTSPG